MRTSLWKGNISFGLINIPVTVHSAEQDKAFHFRMLDKNNMSPIKYKKINAVTGKEVDQKDIVKGYEFEKGKFVLMTKEDFKEANPVATQTIDIEDFVSGSEIDPMLFEKPYYLAPQKGSEKSYFLLKEALADSGKIAVAKVVMHNKEHLACVMPKGKYLVLELLKFSHSVLQEDEVDYLSGIKETKIKPAELKMAEKLIEEMTSEWKPEKYEDTYYLDLKKHIDKKIKAKQGKVALQPVDMKKYRVKPTSSDDLMTLLKKSLGNSAVKKPVKKVTHRRAA